jgi:hypothetical protein
MAVSFMEQTMSLEQKTDCDNGAATTTAEGSEDVLARSGVYDHFAIVDADTANWMVRKIVELRSYRERIDVWAAREKARANHDENFLMMRFEEQLRLWAASEVAQLKGRRKTIFLPAGSVAFRHQKQHLIIDDEKAVLSWAREHVPNGVEVIEKLNKAVLTAHFNSTGEVPALGAHVRPASERFLIK